MALEAKLRRSDDVTILDLSGRIVLGEREDQIHNLSMANYNTGFNRVY